MKTHATVVSVDGEVAIVQVARTSACEGCHKATEEGGCSVCTMMGGERTLATKAENSLGACVGNRVVIESRTGRILWYAVLVFVLPLLLGAACYGLAAWLLGDSLWCMLSFFVGFLGTFGAVCAYSEIVRKKRCDVRITEIIKQERVEEDSTV